MKRINIWKIFTIISLLFWLALIFALSHCPATISDGQSGVLVDVVKNALRIPADHPETISTLTTIIRKCAHSFEYFVLGILALNALRQFWPHGGSHSHQGKVGDDSQDRTRDDQPHHQCATWSSHWYLAIIFAALYATTDELHQIFVPGRSCELRDILIDTLAATAGVGLAMLARHIIKHRKRK